MNQPDTYADLDTIASRYQAQGYSEELSYEMAYAKCDQKEEPLENLND